MMISGNFPTELKEKVKFKFTNEGYTDLGVVITSVVSQLYKSNDGKLIKEIK